jgi:hypothetical protein
MAISEIIPTAVKIDKLINRIEEGDIKIPAFQRGFIWKQEQVIELLDSIYNDYPIGSILLWNSLERLKSTRNIAGFRIPEREPQYPVNYVLDGQQRLSAIFAVFCKDRSVIDDSVSDEYSIDSESFEIYFNLDDDSFVTKDEINEKNSYIKMSALFDIEIFFVELEKLEETQRKKARSLQSKFQNYEIPVVTTNKRSKEEVGVIFERINNTGTKLSTLDLMVAWTWSEDFHLKQEINDLLELLTNKNFGDTPDKIILQCLSGIIDETARTRDILSLDPKKVRNNFSLLKSSLEKSVDYLSTEFNILSRDFLPHSHQIVPLTFFFSRINTPTAEQSRMVKQWFWKTSFSRRYSGSTDMKMNEDIEFFKDVLEYRYDGINKYFYTIDIKSIIKQKFSRSNSFARAMLLLLAQKAPLNLVNGNKIDLGEALSQYNLKEYHHVFPRAFFKNKEHGNERINSICNFCFLPADSNKRILNKAPSDYIFNIVPKDKYSDILNSNLLPLKKEIYLKDNYEEFLNQRAQILLQFLDSLLV